MVKVVEQVEPGKRKRFNKNKKKAWRRRADITEVEEKLEDERREERYGGPLEERDDAELMFLDVGEASKTKQNGDAVILEYTVDKVPESTGKEGSGTSVLKQVGKKKAVKILKTHQFIGGLPGAKTPRKPRKKQDSPTVAMKKKAELQAKDPKLAKIAKKTLKDQANYRTQKKKGRSVMRNTFDFDLWGEGVDDVSQECKKKGLEDSFIKGISEYYRTQRKMRSGKVPKYRHTAPSTLDPVQIPHAGQSYNPSYDDHQKLLERAVRQEKRKEKSKVRVEKATTKFFPTADKAPTEKTWLAEMSEGLPRADDVDGEGEETKGATENVTVSSKAKTERKTKQQRRKEKKQKLSVIKKEEGKQERIRSNNVFRIKAIQKEIQESEELTAQRKMGRLAYRKHLMSRPRRLGKLNYKPEDIALKLGDELPDCLRRASPAVKLIEDRFKNFQRRNLIEVRVPSKNKRKYKQKKQLKRGHREALEKIENMEL